MEPTGLNLSKGLTYRSTTWQDSPRELEVSYNSSTPQDEPRGPIHFGNETKIHREFADRNTQDMASLPFAKAEIIKKLVPWKCVDFVPEEKNSYLLRKLIKAEYFKVQTLDFEAWVHPADKYIKPTDLYNPDASSDENLGKQYFYRAPLHRDQRTNKEAKKYMQSEKKRFEERMQRVYDEHQTMKPQEKEIDFEVLFQQWAKNVRKDFNSFIKRIVQGVNRLFEALRSL